ncbi:MAG: phenylacetate--CoA ligase family protein [Anaerolineae bacterium]|nr:phenylacetate--CoA ligase family protein [Anaerolineae bacterium]
MKPIPELTPLEPWIAHKIGIPGALNRAALEAYQLAALRETLTWAREHSAFYRAHLAHTPARLAGFEDLSALPFTTAADIREDPLRFVCVSQGDIARVVTLDTSGTTGQPKRIYFTAGDQALTVDFFQVGMSTFTRSGDRVLILLPCARPGSVGDLLATALDRLGAEGIRRGPVRDVAETLEILARTQATGLVGIPAQVLALARNPAQPRKLALRFALLTTDHVPRSVVAAVEEAWDCTVYNHYGMTEMGLGGGVDCTVRRGYHLREADLFVETVDPESGAPASPGEVGEIVFTTLTRQGMPLIRYRTGDVGRFLPGACPCGTALKTLAHVTHRFDNVVRLKEGGLLTLADLDETLFALDAVCDFSAALERGESEDTLHIRLALQEAAPLSRTGARRALLALSPIAQTVATGVLRLDITAISGAHVPPPAKRAFGVTRNI